MGATYDVIGIDYANLRRPDPRIAAQIECALGPARSVLNVGAGTGSYEPGDRDVIALEPSAEMIRQRPPGAAPVVEGTAESLPFADKSFDAAMAILTVHHWSDKQRGVSEMRRVARGPVVLLTFDPGHPGTWLTDYFPELLTLDDRQMPLLGDYRRWLGGGEIAAVPIPHDCRDGFLYAYWRRPHAYLDPRIRAAISSFWTIGGVEVGVARLADDLVSGAWDDRFGALLAMAELDAGYRLVVG